MSYEQNMRAIREYTERVNPPDDYYEAPKQITSPCIICGEEVEVRYEYQDALCEHCKKQVTGIIEEIAKETEVDIGTVGYILSDGLDKLDGIRLNDSKDIATILDVMFDGVY